MCKLHTVSKRLKGVAPRALRGDLATPGEAAPSTPPPRARVALGRSLTRSTGAIVQPEGHIVEGSARAGRPIWARNAFSVIGSPA